MPVFPASPGETRAVLARHTSCYSGGMRYQIRLIDQNLPGLARELATVCWHAVDGLVPERVGHGLYRSLCRAARLVLKTRVQSFRFCGAARMCEFNLSRTELSRAPA